MKSLLHRFSQVADSSSFSSSSHSFRCNQILCCDVHHPTLVKRATVASSIPSGLVPVNVGEKMERFLVSAELLNHPVFVGLLNRSAQEYGYAQKGVLHIPCNVFVFEKVAEALRSGTSQSHDVPELVSLLSGEDVSLWLITE
ncbi:auxin-responsive protein SAUR40 [Raphanus sativus]|uniref:Auxin-responsive protein SAUR40 n=1 Tax=Raphanus sativus TaxID=3726 RepID=A0A6J0L6N8_RAPSA|nr:auxin-responsive protein SAUR40 [Raphanus sativus]